MNKVVSEKRKEMLKKAIKLQLNVDELNFFSIKNLPVIDDCYDINCIRDGFKAYYSEKINKAYFCKWCKAYSYAIANSYELKRREDIAYREISSLLCDVASGVESPITALVKIELHNDILEGTKEAYYEIASDCENFCTNEDYDEYKDVISINHKRKTFTVYREVNSQVLDGWDVLGEPYVVSSVSRIVFEGICRQIENLGYKELTFEENNCEQR